MRHEGPGSALANARYRCEQALLTQARDSTRRVTQRVRCLSEFYLCAARNEEADEARRRAAGYLAWWFVAFPMAGGDSLSADELRDLLGSEDLEYIARGILVAHRAAFMRGHPLDTAFSVRHMMKHAKQRREGFE